MGQGAALVLRSVAASLVLPGPHGTPSCSEVTVRVGQDATLVWLPGQVIAAGGCRHDALTHITLEPGARLLSREELLLGRHGERPGTVRQRLRVTLAGRPLHDQELFVGPDAPGWVGPAVLGGRRAVGAVLVVDPEWTDPAEGRHHFTVTTGTDAALLPLGGPAVLLTALAHDALTLHRRLDSLLDGLGHPSSCGTVTLVLRRNLDA